VVLPRILGAIIECADDAIITVDEDQWTCADYSSPCGESL